MVDDSRPFRRHSIFAKVLIENYCAAGQSKKNAKFTKCNHDKLIHCETKVLTQVL